MGEYVYTIRPFRERVFNNIHIKKKKDINIMLLKNNVLDFYRGIFNDYTLDIKNSEVKVNQEGLNKNNLKDFRIRLKYVVPEEKKTKAEEEIKNKIQHEIHCSENDYISEEFLDK